MTCVVAASQLLFACNSTEEGVIPVGGDQVSATEVERFVRRAHLDLLGASAPDEFVSSKSAELIAAGNTAASRADFVQTLIATPEWAIAFADELENRAFAGDGYEFAYALTCSGNRDNNPACSGCTPSADPCTGCSCEAITTLLAERTALEQAADDLTSGAATTGEIERRFAASIGYQFAQAAATLVGNLFEDFVGRPPEPDEIANGVALVVGFVAAPGNAAGLLFKRHGSNYDDMIDIIFTSEIYRDASVTRIFERLLGRIASPLEISYFSSQLDPSKPDNIAVITAVLSSKEYFGQ